MYGGVRSMHRETLEEAPFSFLLQDKQHTQPRSQRATEAPAAGAGLGQEGVQDRGQRHGPARRGFRTEDSDTKPGQEGFRTEDSGKGPGRAVVQHHGQRQPRGAGRGAGLLHVGLRIRWEAGKERGRKLPQPSQKHNEVKSWLSRTLNTVASNLIYLASPFSSNKGEKIK